MTQTARVSQRGVSARAIERRAEVVAALMELFLAEGFAEFSIEDLARRLHCSKSTLYLVAGSKHEIVATVVRAFFRRATERVEATIAATSGAAAQVEAYLEAIAEELQPASEAFFRDIYAHPQTRDIYQSNTSIAAARIREIVAQAQHTGETSVHAPFVGVVTGVVMEAIHRGDIEAGSGLDDPSAYRALAKLIVGGIG